MVTFKRRAHAADLAAHGIEPEGEVYWNPTTALLYQHALVEEGIAAFDAVTLTNPTKVDVKLEPGLAIIGDRSTLVRALLNLLTNAWKYTGDIKQIEIESRAVARWIELIVRDNGPGIERNEQRAISSKQSTYAGRELDIGPNAANPRGGNQFGHIIELHEARDDHAAHEFSWEVFLLAGDPAVQTTLGAAFTEVDPAAAPTFPNRAGTGAPLAKIDYIFYAREGVECDGARVVALPSATVSDHLPLTADLRVGG